MAMSEVDSFIGKFKQLSLSGISASLNLSTSEGKTTVCLKAEFDFVKQSPTFRFNGNERSPSYYRRRTRRQDMRQQAEVFDHKEEAEEAFNDIEKTVTKAEKPAEKMDSKAEKPFEKIVTEAEKSCFEEDISIDGVNMDDVISIEKVVSDVVTDKSVVVDSKRFDETEVDALSQDHDKCTSNMVENRAENASSHTVLVHATAALKNCPNATVDSATMDAVLGIINSSDHVRRYLEAISIGNIRNRPMWRGSSKFMHEVEISLQVIKSSLWEPARSFIWKNIGTSLWTLHDGTQLTFTRIHQK